MRPEWPVGSAPEVSGKENRRLSTEIWDLPVPLIMHGHTYVYMYYMVVYLFIIHHITN